MEVILASQSPRRRELLSQIGVKYRCMVSDKEEKIDTGVPREAVMRLSYQKAEDIYETVKKDIREDTLIVGADTVVACEGRIMGKPSDNKNAEEMLKLLRGKCHSVWTGVTIIYISGENIVSDTFEAETRVYMYDMSDDEIKEYVESGEPSDKAGAYAIQGLGARYIEKIEGDYNNVVGLPVSQLYQKLKEYGIKI